MMPKGWKSWLTGGFALVLIVSVAMSGIGRADELRTDAPEAGRLVATGEATLDVEPDLAVISLGVETVADRVSDAAAQNAKQIDSLQKRLISLGIPEDAIKTERYDVYPEWSYPSQDSADRKLIGYRVVNQMQVEVTDLDALGRYLDAAIQAGANSVRGISFSLKDSKTVEAQVLEAAVEDAGHKARVMSEAAGVALGKIVRMSENTSVPGRGRGPYMAMEAVKSSQAATIISPGTIQVRATVTVEYSI